MNDNLEKNSVFPKFSKRHIESAINQVITTIKGVYIINQSNFDSLINIISCIIQLS